LRWFAPGSVVHSEVLPVFGKDSPDLTPEQAASKGVDYFAAAIEDIIKKDVKM
jgi:hypothetical protein